MKIAVIGLICIGLVVVAESRWVWVSPEARRDEIAPFYRKRTVKGELYASCNYNSDCKGDYCVSNMCMDPIDKEDSPEARSDEIAPFYQKRTAKAPLYASCSKNADCEGDYCVYNMCMDPIDKPKEDSFV